MWMNESEIEEAAHKFAGHSVMSKATKFLSEFCREVNAHSDGWPYWSVASKAADKLMDLIHAQMWQGMGAYPRVPEPTMAEIQKTLTPIKAFYTRRGFAAGMKLPAF